MKFVRIEEFEVQIGVEEDINDVRNVVEKTQDLTLDSIEVMENVLGYRVKVKRALESFPDTIK